MTNKLIEIRISDLIQLRDLYLIDWPRNLVGYYTLDNFIKWMKIDPKIKNLKIFSLNGDWSDGTFLVIDRYQLFLNTLSNSNERLELALTLLDWSKGFKISTFLERHRQVVLKVIEEKNLKKEYDSLTPVYHLPKEKAEELNLKCPDNIILKSVSEADALVANDVWPNRHEGSDFFLKRLANWNINIGAYTQSGNDLVAWCFRLQAGPLGALQTKETHFRSGLGSLVTIAMAKQLAKIGHDTIACVGHENLPSQKMFEKLGFHVIDNAYWLRTYPTFDFHWSD